ncbi:tetratricopeptide repeat protein [Sphingobium sp. CAP-1]|uniref:tetratricopeptide repeat protein n=1 Tax=Sphingobium sp. CAP-1 TaxID=2676077 RepID=UPI0012BB3D53|nr:tetratricopeptide repeat protein [Sphingobium sp. CAP-1]QGP80919.1 tetratricopeptide repeat protein [Sphingobium sp. CAP-1]
MRLDGWKAISAYIGRDRSTVIRWAGERGLPVRRMPGGKQATVYALSEDIDNWVASGARLDDGLPADPAQRRPGSLLRWVAPVAILLTVGGGLLYWATRPAAEAVAPPAALPHDPHLAALYLRAREDWARRDQASIARAIAKFGLVTRSEPAFAPAHAALAEALLLSREFGALDDQTAFTQAEREARRALALDPRLHTGHRALGFVDYWWNGDPQSAGRHFRAALALAPGDAQTYFWYGNILSDNGAADAALAAFGQAIALQPGQPSVQIDHAWAQWSAGRDYAAENMLRELASQERDDVVYHETIAYMRLAQGNWPGFVDAYCTHARLRGEPGVMAEAKRLAKARAGGDPMIAATMFAIAMQQAEDNPRHPYTTAAMIASLSGDRGQLITILHRALARGEHWGGRAIANESPIAGAATPKSSTCSIGCAWPAWCRPTAIPQSATTARPPYPRSATICDAPFSALS